MRTSLVIDDFAFQRVEQSMWRYRSSLPIAPDSVPVTLGEGLTPLLRARSGPPGMRLFLKNETINPTGSHKDRALSVSITKAIELGHSAVMLYSDGSTALSSAAYAARAGLRSFVVVAMGTPDYRVLPLYIYNSTVLEYQGSSAEALAWTSRACRAVGLYETTTYRAADPYGAEGAKTISFEIVEQVDGVPAWVIVPVGGGGTISAIWRGFQELYEEGKIASRPRLAAVLPNGYSLLERAFVAGASTDDDLRALMMPVLPPTIQVKTAMAYPPDGIEAIRAIRESNGLFFYATDDQVLQGQRRLGQEGVFAEPSAASVMTAADRLSKLGIAAQDTVVAIITGSGFRELGAMTHSIQIERQLVDSISGIDNIRRLLSERKNIKAL